MTSFTTSLTNINENPSRFNKYSVFTLLALHSSYTRLNPLPYVSTSSDKNKVFNIKGFLTIDSRFSEIKSSGF